MSVTPAPAATHATVVIVGAGPTASSLLERLAANAGQLPAPGVELTVHVVDPHEPGVGRVWRADAPSLVWMNSLAEDVTLFPDASCRIEGPARPGPSLAAWAQAVDPQSLPSDLVDEVAALQGRSFPTRRVQTEYLRWFHREVLASLPSGLHLVTHRVRAVDVVDRPDGRQEVVLADGGVLVADVVVLALGHLDAEPDAARAVLHRDATAAGLVDVPAGHTVEQDWSVLVPGEPVIVLGFGQAFTDLAVLVTEGRGGRFVAADGGALRYEPSGEEPVLYVGSRRGVPYRSKIDHVLSGPLPPLPRFFDDAAIAALLDGDELLDYDRDLVPLVRKEIGWAYYHELFASHPERTSMPWAVFAERYAARSWGPAIDALVAEAVPDAEDRLDLDRLDRPLAWLRFPSLDALQTHLVAHVRADVARRTNPRFSADAAKFVALLVCFGQLSRVAASGRVSERSRIEGIGQRFFSSFMYDASGPPPARLRQVVALVDAGVVRFIGADTTVEMVDGSFVATSSSHPDQIRARALVDAQIPGPSVSRSVDPLVRRLHERGELVEETGADPSTGWTGTSGRAVVAGPDLRPVHADGSRHPRRHAIGIWTSRPGGGALARPGTNALIFRQHDAVARSILRSAAAGAAGGAVLPSPSSEGVRS